MIFEIEFIFILFAKPASDERLDLDKRLSGAGVKWIEVSMGFSLERFNIEYVRYVALNQLLPSIVNMVHCGLAENYPR